MKLRLGVVLVGAMLLAGCAAESPQDAFAPVQGETLALSGHRVVWNQGSADDAQAAAEVQHLLREPLDANRAAQVALLNSPDLQATFEEIGISQADLVQAGLLKNPVFAASWRFPDVAPGITDAEYSLAQDFLSLVLIPLKVKVAKANLEAAQDRVTHEVIHLVAEVKTEFYSYQGELELEQQLGLLIKADQAAADLAKAQHDAGNVSDAAYLNEEMPLAGAQSALAEAKKAEIASREKLNRLMGAYDDETSWKARAKLPDLPAGDGKLEHLEKLAMAQRRDLRAQQKEVDAIGEMLALKTNTRYLPASLDVGADTEKQTDAQRITGPTLDLELPIFDQGQGEIAKLAAEYRQAKHELQALVVQIQSEVREARETLTIDRQQVTQYRKVVVPLNEKAVNQTMLQFNAMQVNTYDLLLTKQRELDAQKDYIEAWRDYWMTRAQLEEAVGGNLHPGVARP